MVKRILKSPQNPRKEKMLMKEAELQNKNFDNEQKNYSKKQLMQNISMAD
jgi:hypothetical protein